MSFLADLTGVKKRTSPANCTLTAHIVVQVECTVCIPCYLLDVG